MASVNKVILVGRTGSAPERRQLRGQGLLATVGIATTSQWRDRTTSENREATEWHRIVFEDQLAERALNELKRGQQLYLEGKLRTRKWTEQASGQERYATEIVATFFEPAGPEHRPAHQAPPATHDGYGSYAPPAPPRQPAAPAQQRYGRHRG